MATRVQRSVFAEIVEFMLAAAETCIQKHDEGNVEADAEFKFLSELVRRRFLMAQLLGEIEPLICRVAGELRILVVGAIGVCRSNPELRCSPTS